MKAPFLTADLRARIEKLVGGALVSWLPVEGGYTPALRLICENASGRFFVKVGVTPLTADFLRREISIYERVSGDFMPHVLGWEDHETWPILILENLSAFHWPPPWNRHLVDRVLAQIDEMHSASPPIETFEQFFDTGLPGWAQVAADPLPFLSLGLVGAGWLEESLPVLLAYESRYATTGSNLAHFDLRSDNIAIGGSSVVFVDWNHACLANKQLDTGFWLPSLTHEGGPRPEKIMPEAPEVAAKVSGYFASRAGLAQIPDAPRVRAAQRHQLETALPWVIGALELPPLSFQS